MQLLKKISVKNVCGDVSDIMKAAIAEKESFPKLICEIFGIASEVFKGEGGIRQTFEGLKGTFEAVNTITGEDFSSYTAFMPDQGIGFVRSLLLGSEGKPVEFGVAVSIQPPTRKGSQMMYEYVVKPIGSVDRSAKLAALRERMKANGSV